MRKVTFNKKSKRPSFRYWLPAATLLLAGCSQMDPGNPATMSAGSGTGQPAGVMNVADAAIAGGDPNMALKVSQSVLATDPRNLDALYHEGAAYYAVNRCMDAIAVYKVALTVQPNSSPAETGIGRCLLKRDAKAAEAAFTAAVQADPGNAAALNDLGVARDLQGNHAGAIQPYQQALLIDPGVTATEVNLGMSLALAGNGEDALQYLGPIATSNDATPKIRQDYAAALIAAGREPEARQVLAVDLPPDQVDALIADFSSAIAAPAPQAPPDQTASAPAPTNVISTPAPVQSTPIAPPPMADAAPVSAAPIADAPPPMVQAAPPPIMVQAAPAPAAMAPEALPSASMSSPGDSAADGDQVVR